MLDLGDILLQPKQGKLFSLLCATGRNVATTIGFGGAKGGGKSDGADSCALGLALELGNKYPGIVITIMRRVARDLRDNHINRITRKFPEMLQLWHESGMEFRLTNSSRIAFSFAETKGDTERKFLGGYESAFIFVDEAQQFTEEELQWIKAACRWTDPKAAGIPEGLCKLVLLFNPGGKSADYLRRIFWTQSYRSNEDPRSFAFLHVFGWDNYEWFRGQVDVSYKAFYMLPSAQRFQMFIDETSEGRKYNAFPDSIRKGYLLGSFDHFEGQYFAGAWDDKCIMTAHKAKEIIQPWWTRWMSQDWAFAEHAAHYWFASGKISPSKWMELFGGSIEHSMDIVIAYREHVISNRAEADMATDVVAMTPQAERPLIHRFFFSEDGFGKRSRQGSGNTVGESYANIFGRYGLPRPEPADQNRVLGWRFMYNCMRQAQLIGTPVSEERAKQGPAFFVTEECPQAISCIPMAIRDEDDPDDVARVDGALWEDVNDGLRYGLHSLLNPMSKAPRDVRAKELYHSIQGSDPADVMTARAMAMRQFQEKENSTTRISRGQRWR